MIQHLLKWSRLCIHPIWQALLCTTLTACVANQPYYSREASTWEKDVPDPDNKLLYSVFLIGDARPLPM